MTTTTPVRLLLIQETDAPASPPEGEPLNAPATDVRWRVIGPELPETTTVPHAHWSASALEDWDMFDAVPGWRVFGADAPDVLRAEGHQVEVETLADLRAHAEHLREIEREREARLQQAWDERLAQVAAHQALHDRLTEGMQRTGYSPYWTSQSLADLEVIDRLPSSRTPAPWQWRHGRPVLHLAVEQWSSTLYRAPEGIVRQRIGSGSNYSVDLWADGETADRLRAEQAAEMGITADRATRGLAGRYVGDDQRRMYLVALPSGQRTPALLVALRKLSTIGVCPWCEGTGEPQPEDGRNSRCRACHGSGEIREANLSASDTVAAWAVEHGASPQDIASARSTR